MTTQDVSRDQLVELVTREVLAALAERADICANPTKLREVVANGADRVSFHGDAEDVPLDLAKYIDHTLLRPDATLEEIDVLCDEAMENGFASVCINPYWVKRSADKLRGSDVKVCTVRNDFAEFRRVRTDVCTLRECSKYLSRYEFHELVAGDISGCHSAFSVVVPSRASILSTRLACLPSP